MADARKRARTTTAARRSPARPRSRRPAKPALGNDPFERGAAPRAAPAQPPPPPPPVEAAAAPAPTPPPSAPSAPAPRREERSGDRIAAVERKVTSALEGLEARLMELADQAGLAGRGRELREAVAALLPRLRTGLASAVDVVRLLEPAERLDRFGMDPRFVERFAPIAELLYHGWWRTVVREAARVPSSGPALVVANHAGVVPWDALVLQQALRLDHPARRELRPLLDDRECALPLIGSMAVRLGGVRASPEAASTLLREGKLVGVFPEGSAGARKPWRERYRLQRFGRGGFVKVALRARAPIVPCAIVGSEEASPAISRSGWLAERLGVPLIGRGAALRFGPAALVPLPSRWSLHFGPPIDVTDHPPSDADDGVVVNAITERVRSTLQLMLDEDLAARGAVFL